MGDNGMNKKMKSMGRNLARASNQASGGKITMKYAEGGMVGRPPVAVKDKPEPKFGSGMARGTGAATKGKAFGGIR